MEKVEIVQKKTTQLAVTTGFLDQVAIENETVCLSGWVLSFEPESVTNFKVLFGSQQLIGFELTQGLPSPGVKKAHPNISAANNARFIIRLPMNKQQQQQFKDALIILIPLVADREGEPLLNAVNPALSALVKTPEANNLPSQTPQVELISVHVPKAAGTAFRQVLLQVYGTQGVLTDKTNMFEDNMPATIHWQTKVIEGHFRAGKYDKLFPDTKRITWLREPIHRLISDYCFRHISNPTKDYLNKQDLLKFAQINSNLMAYCVNGKSLDYFDFVGITEYFEEDLLALKNLLGWSDYQVIYQNRNPYPEYLDFQKEVLSDKKLMDELASANSQDMELYAAALKLRAEGRRKKEEGRRNEVRSEQKEGRSDINLPAENIVNNQGRREKEEGKSQKSEVRSEQEVRSDINLSVQNIVKKEEGKSAINLPEKNVVDLEPYTVPEKTKILATLGSLDKAEFDRQELLLIGWAVSRNLGAVKSFQLTIAGTEIENFETALNLPSPDVRKLHPNLHNSDKARFRIKAFLNPEQISQFQNAEIVLTPIFKDGKGQVLSKVKEGRGKKRCDPASAKDASGRTPRRPQAQGNADQERECAPREEEGRSNEVRSEQEVRSGEEGKSQKSKIISEQEVRSEEEGKSGIDLPEKNVVDLEPYTVPEKTKLLTFSEAPIIQEQSKFIPPIEPITTIGHLDKVAKANQKLIISGWVGSYNFGSVESFKVFIGSQEYTSFEQKLGLPSPDVAKVRTKLNNAENVRFCLEIPLTKAELQNCQNTLITLTPIFQGKEGEILFQLLNPSLPIPDDKYIEGKAINFIQRSCKFLGDFIQRVGLQPTAEVLEIGCGVGNIAYGLAYYLKSPGRYEGNDFSEELISWAQQNISSHKPHFNFRQIDSDLKLPYDDKSFDFVFIGSRFTQVGGSKIRNYLDEIYRVLKPGGRFLFQCFLVNHESEKLISEGKSSQPLIHRIQEGFTKDLNSPEKGMGFLESLLLEWLINAGFNVLGKYYGSWCGRVGKRSYPDMVILEKEEVRVRKEKIESLVREEVGSKQEENLQELEKIDSDRSSEQLRVNQEKIESLVKEEGENKQEENLQELEKIDSDRSEVLQKNLLSESTLKITPESKSSVSPLLAEIMADLEKSQTEIQEIQADLEKFKSQKENIPVKSLFPVEPDTSITTKKKLLTKPLEEVTQKSKNPTPPPKPKQELLGLSGVTVENFWEIILVEGRRKKEEGRRDFSDIEARRKKEEGRRYFSESLVEGRSKKEEGRRDFSDIEARSKEEEGKRDFSDIEARRKKEEGRRYFSESLVEGRSKKEEGRRDFSDIEVRSKEEEGRGDFSESLVEGRRDDSKPSISILTPTWNSSLDWFVETVLSVLNQSIPNWEWCIVDDGSKQPEIRNVLAGLAEKEPRIKVLLSEDNGGISAATNKALNMATGEYICLLDHDDTLAPTALEDSLNKLAEGFDVVYSDEDKIDFSGLNYIVPFFKPDWSPEYFRGVMYVGHLLCVRRELALAAGGFKSEFDGVQDYEFMLRVSEQTNKIAHISRHLYHWRQVKGSISGDADAKAGIEVVQQAAVNSHLQRIGLAAKAEPGVGKHRININPLPRNNHPFISLIIAAPNLSENIDKWSKNLLSVSTYPKNEVILVGGEKTENIIENSAVKVLNLSGQFNYSRAYNLAAKTAQGEYFIFLNTNLEVVTEDWQRHLLYYAEQPDIGAVGGLLIFPDGIVEHAGIVLGKSGKVDYVMRGFPSNHDGYAGSLVCAREVSAVSRDCLMVSRQNFEMVGGFNEHFFSDYQDVDLCLKLRKNGKRIVFTPRSVLINHQSEKHRQRNYDVVDYMLLLDQWQICMDLGDPYYNLNFDIQRNDYTVVL
ncbi:glycosyltransferase [Okeania sp. SIO2B3]|uniref:glycosyltransferase n=1 Tax=Okeania sp. SIO2B3 TaxID=2607784 RepID=UPI0013C1FC8E|nr:glycosyltransferase [Okeania sp. SIO2B3]NET42657.1 glycosyltransferase [Okeania sp. SIO2B3]